MSRSRVAKLLGRFGAAELARRVGVSDATVRRWAREGTPYARQDELRAVERRSEAARRAAEARRAPEKPKHVRSAATVERWLDEGIPARTFERLVDELAPSRSTAARWRREEKIPAARLEAIAWAPPPKKKKKKRHRETPPPPPTIQVEQPEPVVVVEPPAEAPPSEIEELRAQLDAARAELEQARRDEAAEREAIQAEAEEAEEGAVPEDVYPLPTRDLEFFRAHDRTDMEGITGIHFDAATGRVVGTNDQGEKVAAYLFTEENGQPKTGPDSLRWALAQDLETYVAHINRAIRERYGDNTLRGAFSRFNVPKRQQSKGNRR